MKSKQTNSKESAVEIMKAAAQPVHPPSNIPLDKSDLPFFVNVIAEFARAQWTDHAREVAAMLARTMNDLNREQQELRLEGFISVRANGTTVENPRARAVKSLTGDILSLRRSLGVNQRAREEAHNTANKTAIAKSIEANNVLDDGLIARPQ